MKYRRNIIINIKKFIEAENAKFKYRTEDKWFTRSRKMDFQKVVLYNLNKKGLTSKMEIVEFDEIVNSYDISSSGVLQQREKLDAQIYLDLLHDNVKLFYNEHPDEVKLFHGYILTAIDGSDFEIPNTIKTRKEFNSAKNNTSVARAHISNAFDVLNHCVLDTQIGPENSDEKEMDSANLKAIKDLELKFPVIRTKDRGYVSIKDIYYSCKDDDKFVTRLKKSDFREIIENMASNDEFIEIPYQYDRVRYWKNKDEEFYNIMESKRPTLKVRCVKILLKTGEIEYLITNLTQEEASYTEMNELYKLRWQIEINYHTLKESLKIETISSSKENLIRQDIYSQMIAFNVLQAFVNDANEKVKDYKYKHQMAINMNMAIGFFKKFFLLILTTDDVEQRDKLMNTLEKRIEKYLEPIRPNRQYPRNKNKKNKHHINKRKSF